jgi:putative redox protein
MLSKTRFMTTMEVTFEEKKKVIANINGSIIPTDQSWLAGGDDSAPTPFELFLASIGTCAGIYVKSFCDKRRIPTENIRIIQEVETDFETGLPARITLDIKLPADFPEKYKEAVIKAADQCKVKQTIAAPPVFEVVTSVEEVTA